MSKIILFIACSLDGFIARKNGDISWLHPFENKKEDYGYAKFLKTTGAIYMGANTYKQMFDLGWSWPYEKIPSFITTKRAMPKIPHAPLEFISKNLIQHVKKTKTRLSRKNIWLVGGTKLATTFLNAGLVDEMIISIIPVLLNEGLPLFENLKLKLSLKLLTSQTYPIGIVQLRYSAKI